MGNAEVGVDAEILRCISEQLADVVRCRILSADANAAGVCSLQPAQNGDERRFSGAISSEQSKDLPWFDAKVDSAQNFVGAVALVDSLSF